MMSPAREVTGLRVIRRSAPDGTELVQIEVLAREAGLHPQLVSRFVALGLLEPSGGTSRSPLFPRDAAGRLARAGRLRRDLGLSYAGAVLACELLARIEDLEARLAGHDAAGRYPPTRRAG